MPASMEKTKTLLDTNKQVELKMSNPLESELVSEEEESSDLEQNLAILRQQAVLTAAAMWITRAQTAPVDPELNNKRPVSSEIATELVPGSLSSNPRSFPTLDAEGDDKIGCSVGVYLVRSDGCTCTREQVTEGIFRHSHPSTQQLLIMWEAPPKVVFVLKKLGKNLLPELLEAVKLLHEEKVTIFVEEHVYFEIEEAMQVQPELPREMIDSVYVHSLHNQVDLVLCLGGDGVILHASSIFQGPCPPILGVNLGSMGFLAPHTFTGLQSSIEEAMMLSAPCEKTKVDRGNLSPCDGVPVTLRMRLHCQLWEDGKQIPGSQEFEVLNELCIDRGPSSFLSMIECYELTYNDQFRLLTKVQADGLIVSTATGSTAYSVSAGGSMVHPSVPAILVTPICPHSLSFRPVVLPDSVSLLLRVPEDARSTAWVCFDGKSRQEIRRGCGIMVTMSEYPMPTVNWGDHMSEFVGSLVRCLNWNDREEQKPLETPIEPPLNAPLKSAVKF